MLTTPRGEHHGGGRRQGLGRGRRRAGEDAAVEAHAERSTRVHWFGCSVRLPLPQGLASGGNSRGRGGLRGSTAGHGRQEHAAFLCVIRRHFLAAVVDLAVSLSTYSTLPMEVVP